MWRPLLHVVAEKLLPLAQLKSLVQFMLKFVLYATRSTQVSREFLIPVDASLSSKSVSERNLSSFFKGPHVLIKGTRGPFILLTTIHIGEEEENEQIIC